MQQPEQISQPDVNRRRVVICSSGIPHASRGASVVLFFHYIRAIVEGEWQVLHVILPGKGEGGPALQGYIEEMSRYGDFTAIECAIEQPLFLGRWSGQVRATALPASVERKIAEFAPDLFFCLDISCAALMRNSAAGKRMVAWLGDLTFDTVWYHNLYDARENPLAYLKLPLTTLRREGWRQFYRATLDGAAAVIASSISSVEKLAALGIRSEYLPYPWPVDLPVPGADRTMRAKTPSFFFFGTLSALGSRSAFRFLVDKLYPRLLALWGAGGFVIYICGMRELPGWVGEALRSRQELVFKGFVDDLDQLGRSCHAMLAPIDVPVGNRSRIVTAMAYGWPFIAHANTTLGNPDLSSGKNCFLAADVEQFVEHMRFTVEQPDAALALGQAARASYERTFSPRIATGMMLERMQAALTAHADQAGSPPRR
jgi:glycosyltransferase involved in cell wall biosynthesis